MAGCNGRDGVRQILFITGEAGLERRPWSIRLLRRPAVGLQWIGRGQCIEHYGAGEPICPCWRPLGNSAGDSTASMREVLARQAPTWLVQLPWLSNDETL
jgi:hypothetical protein